MTMTVYRMDCHTHPLEHRHYPCQACNAPLDSSDKSAVEQMIRSGMARGLDAIAITDHNQSSSGLYGKQWAKDNGLKIKVVAGCECSHYIFENYEIHILALGLLEPLFFNQDDAFSDLVNKIHAAGAIAVLAHPHYYPSIYPLVKGRVDGVEYYNGVNATAYDNDPFFREAEKDFKGILTKGSDYHMTNFPSTEQLAAVTYVDESMYPLWCRIGL